jgi:hypothetical protein
MKREDGKSFFFSQSTMKAAACASINFNVGFIKRRLLAIDKCNIERNFYGCFISWQ